MIFYLDFDDYYSFKTEGEVLSILYYLKSYFTNFKVNLFTVWERRTPDELLMLTDWVLPCLHGVYHLNNESVNEGVLNEWYGAKVYRAPYWQLSNEMHKRLTDLDWKVMLNPEDPNEKRDGIYFNWNLKDYLVEFPAPTVIAHGHITPYDNGIRETYERIIEYIPKDATFGFLTELENKNRYAKNI